MLLTRLLNACHHFSGYVYKDAKLFIKTNYIEVNLVSRAGSKPVCSVCHKPAACYDHLACRRFEFIPIWGYAVFFLYKMRRVSCKHCGICGDGQQYVSLVYDIGVGTKRLLWIGKERTLNSFERFFTMIGKERAEKILFVCSDMWRPYLA